MIPLWFLPFAIACGNTFILKPSERDPRPVGADLRADRRDRGDPDGVCNLVHGARDAVNGAARPPGVDAISFVGQASTARYVAERSAATGKRCQALGGAKNSLVVMPDADLEMTVPAIMGSAFGAAGQRCLAGSVAVLVGDGERQDEVRDALVAAASGLRVGAGRRRTAPTSARWSRPRPASAIVGALERGRAAGAEVVLDGRAAEPGPGRDDARADDRRGRRTRSPSSRARSCSGRC